MTSMNNGISHFHSWTRKGVGTNIVETDGLGKAGTSRVMERPYVQLTMNVKSTSVSDGKEVTSNEQKNISIVGPGDVLSVSSNAVMNVSPQSGNENFPVSHLPYIEFWEPDFAWRYTPVSASGNKLRPWLAIVLCEVGQFSVEKNEHGVDVVTFKVQDESQFNNIFPDPSEVWKSAHAQSGEDDKELEFCRIIALKRPNSVMKEETEYSAFLIPVFEVGRLRGIGCDADSLKTVYAQYPSWENIYSKQIAKERPFTYPSYYSWRFKTGSESFYNLVNSLSGFEVSKSGTTVDVTDMGEGLSYSILSEEPERKTIVMPSALQTLGNEPEAAFPSDKSSSDEKVLHDRLVELLSLSPVFNENASLINSSNSAVSDDDPWVTPPIYGGKHIMATSLKGTKENPVPNWFKQVNLDLHYRAAAGLGKKVVQENQEEFVNRAWRQIDLVKALNNELYQKLLSANVDQVIKNRTYKGIFDKKIVENPTKEDEISADEFVKNLLISLESMKNTSNGDSVSFASLLDECDIPTSFASTEFKNKVQQISAKCPDMNLSSLMGDISSKGAHETSNLRNNAYPVYSEIPRKKDIFKAYAEELVKKYPYVKDGSSHKVSDLLWLQKADDVQTKLSFMRSTYTTVFCNYSSIYGDSFNRTNAWYRIPDSYMGVWVSFGTTLTFSSISKMLRGLYSEEYNIVPCYGYIVPDSQGFGSNHLASNVGNIIGLESGIYSELFGSKLMSLIHLWNGSRLLVVDKDKLLAEMKKDSSLRKLVKSYVNVYKKKHGIVGKVDVLDNKFDKSIPLDYVSTIKFTSFNDINDALKALNKQGYDLDPLINAYKDSKKNFVSATMTYSKVVLLKHANKPSFYARDCDALCITIGTEFKDKTVKYVANNLIFEIKNDATAKEDNELRDKVFGRPDYFEIGENTLKDEKFLEKYVQVIDNPVDYAQLVAENIGEKHPLIRALNDYDTQVASLAKRRSTRRPRYRFSSPVEVKTPLSSLQKKINACASLNESMETVVNNYFVQFLGVNDSKTGKQLRERYLDDLLHSKYPVMAYPIFPEPSYYYLKQLSDAFILPCVDELPDNSVSVFKSNEAFVESYLCGMNTEMGKELLWREYPTDQRGSYFKKFWDCDNDPEDIRNNKFFDVKSVHTWEKDLGQNHEESKSGLVLFAIKGKLMKNFPDTQIYLHKARFTRNDNGEMHFDMYTRATEKNGGIINPVAQAFFRDDIYVVGFKVPLSTLVGDPSSSSDNGYMLTFKQESENLSFNLENVDCKVGSSADFAKETAVQPYVCAKHVLTYL